jgi:hypothetical protein
MTLLIPPGFAQVTFNHQYVEGAEPAICTMGMDLNSYAGTLTAAADEIATAWSSIVRFEMSNAVIFLGAVLRVGVAGGEPATYEAPRNVNGQDVRAQLTRNTSLLVKKVTARGGRRGRGRMFVPGLLPEFEVDQAGNLTAALIGGLQTVFNNLDTALTGIGGGMQLLHDDQVVTSYNPVTGKPVTSTINPGPPDPVFQLVVDPRAATQRKRMRN